MLFGTRKTFKSVIAAKAAALLAWAATEQGDNLTNALVQLRQLTHPGSLIFIISDFQSMDKQAEKHLTKLASNNHI